MAVELALLGAPRVLRDGAVAERPRGRKPWALLAHLALAERPVPRERLALLLFEEADDPLGALRWNLAEARRLVGVGLGGEVLALPQDVQVDVRQLQQDWQTAEPVARSGGGLLEGLSFPANPAFDAWLSGERYRLDGLRAAVLRASVVGRLASGDAPGAVAAAQALLGVDPHDEGAHVLLVRALVACGEREQAQAAVERCTSLLQRATGRPPSAALSAELEPPRPSRPSGRAAARALLEAGTAAVAAGAVDVGLTRLRDAAAQSGGEPDVEVAALTELGYALVHAVRGRDEAGSAVLARAVDVAERAGRPELAAAAHRELGYVAFLASRHPEALRHLAEADALGVPEERAGVAAIRGAVLTEAARYGEAARELTRAVALASDLPRWRVWAGTMLGRLHLLLDDAVAARPPLEEALAVARDRGWTSVVPWPQALLAEVDLREDRAGPAEDAALHAHALGCELRDPCWEATAGRVLALVAVRRGDRAAAREALLEARARGVLSTDGWRFAHAEVLDALAALAPAFPAEGRGWIGELEATAGAGGMRELLVRAQLHRAACGQVGAREAAAALAEGIDNPALHARAGVAAAASTPTP